MTMEQIVCEKRTYTDRKLTHAHDYVQLLFPLRGSLKLITATHEMRRTEEHAFCLTPHTEHTFYALDRNEFLVLDIPAEKLLPYDGKVIGRHFPLDDKWLALRQLLLSEITAPNSDEFRLELLMDYTFASLLTEAKAYRSIAYIHRHYGRKINVHTNDMLSLLLRDRKSTRLNSSHVAISYAVFCLKKKKIIITRTLLDAAREALSDNPRLPPGFDVPARDIALAADRRCESASYMCSYQRTAMTYVG